MPCLQLRKWVSMFVLSHWGTKCQYLDPRQAKHQNCWNFDCCVYKYHVFFFIQAPDWVDAEECHRCRVQFGVMTRKVGGAFLKVGHLKFLWFSLVQVQQRDLVYEPMHWNWPDFVPLVFLAPLSCLWTDFLWKMFIEILNHSKVWHREGSTCVWAVLWAAEQVSIQSQSNVARYAW